jgi:hypothetical protein
MNGNPSPTTNPRRPDDSLHYSRPQNYFGRTPGRHLSRTQNAYLCSRVGNNEE